MSVEAIPYCIYGYCVSTDEFKYMIDLANYDTLWDWIEDYNRYEWCVWDEWNDCVYFGLPIDATVNAKEMYYEWVLFKLTPIENYVNLTFLPKDAKEEGPHFHVFNIWDYQKECSILYIYRRKYIAANA